jgi:ubiquinone/menaquinone biosynthesis C-methylase UbiE
MAADDIAAKVQHFDGWYAAMAGSTRRDEIVRRHLGLPAAMLSSSLLPWEGIAEVVELLRLHRPATLVDLGCGRGGYGLEVAARTGASLIGVDFSAEAIRQAEQYADSLGRDARFVVADIAATGLPTASVDGVMCIDAVHIVSEPADVFGELRRVLRPGGRAVVTNWEARDRDNDTLPEWVRRVDCAGWFAAAGFIDIAVVERQEWEQKERALWAAAAAVDPAGDEAVASLRDEAIEEMPHVPLTRRVLASATAPSHRALPTTGS